MSNTSIPPQQLLTRQEAAAFLGVCPHSLMKWAKIGRIREIRLTRRAVRYRMADLEKFIAEGANK